MDIEGLIKLLLKISKAVINFEALVVTVLPRNLIIGMNVLKVTGAIIDCAGHTVTFKGCTAVGMILRDEILNVWDSIFEVVLDDNYTIPAFSEMQI